MFDPLEARSVLRAYGLTAKKKLGQNFIINQNAIDKVLDAARMGVHEQILEIGAGLGSLTLSLAKGGHTVHAIEFDPELIPILKDLLKAYNNVRIIQGDILKLALGDILEPAPYLVVANIPYQITSAVIRKLVETPFPARRVVLTIQKEVAQRIVAGPGDSSLLALSVQVFGHPEIKSDISPEAFYPQPKVYSSVITIEMYPEPRIPGWLLGDFFRIAKAGFSQKRKKLRNALAGGLGIPASKVEELMGVAGISPSLRAQALDLEQWQQLADVVKGEL